MRDFCDNIFTSFINTEDNLIFCDFRLCHIDFLLSCFTDDKLRGISTVLITKLFSEIQERIHNLTEDYIELNRIGRRCERLHTPISHFLFKDVMQAIVQQVATLSLLLINAARQNQDREDITIYREKSCKLRTQMFNLLTIHNKLFYFKTYIAASYTN